MRFNQRFEQAKDQVGRFMDRQGFFIVIFVCVSVIAASAMLSGHTTLAGAPPTLPPYQAQSAAQLYQQSLAEAIHETPAPTRSAPSWQNPLPSIAALRAFSSDRLIPSDASGILYVHDAVDLASEEGEPVSAMASGTVQDSGSDAMNGAWVTVAHGDVLATYAGLYMTPFKPGDPVRAGQTVGFVGNVMQDEKGLGPHLHLRTERDGSAFDPLSLLK